MQQPPIDCQQLQIDLQYTFINQEFLYEALTHSTYAYEHRQQNVISNERLEFLGDAVLDLAIGEMLFHLAEKHDEGFMSKTRALIVCESTLARVARQLNIGDMLQLGRGETATGGGTKASNLANAMEAVFGAIYLDSDYETARRVILHLLDEPILEAIAGTIHYDYKSRLLEYAQSIAGFGVLRFVILDERGPVHERLFTAGVMLEDSLIGSGSGNSKKEAEQQAARAALDQLTRSSE